MMTKEIENERSCFWNILLYLDTKVKAWVEPGAFILKVAHGDSIVEYRDRGLCTGIRLDAVNDRDIAYLDSAHRAYLFHDGIQPRVSGHPPVRAWGRYPPKPPMAR